LLTQCNEKEKVLARGIQCRTWDRRRQGWRFPIRPEVIRELQATFNVAIPAEACSICEDIERKETAVREAKLQGWENAEPVDPMPVKVKAFQHQVLAYNLCLELLGI